MPYFLEIGNRELKVAIGTILNGILEIRFLSAFLIFTKEHFKMELLMKYN